MEERVIVFSSLPPTATAFFGIFLLSCVLCLRMFLSAEDKKSCNQDNEEEKMTNQDACLDFSNCKNTRDHFDREVT